MGAVTVVSTSGAGATGSIAIVMTAATASRAIEKSTDRPNVASLSFLSPIVVKRETAKTWDFLENSLKEIVPPPRIVAHACARSNGHADKSDIWSAECVVQTNRKGISVFARSPVGAQK